MATYDCTDGGVTAVQYQEGGRLRAVLDIKKIIEENAVPKAAGYLAANDVLRAIAIPIGGFVRWAGIWVKEACDASTTASIGDDSGAAYWAAATTTATAGGCFGTVITDYYVATAMGKLYTSTTATDRTINVKLLTTTFSKGVLVLTVDCTVLARH